MINRVFSRFATKIAEWAGSFPAFGLSLGIVSSWAVTGPFFGFSSTWQLVINTGTTVITFLMVFVIQNSQNRDALAVHIKLDEIIRALAKADNRMIDAEHADDEKLAKIKDQYRALNRDPDR